MKRVGALGCTASPGGQRAGAGQGDRAPPAPDRPPPAPEPPASLTWARCCRSRSLGALRRPAGPRLRAREGDKGMAAGTRSPACAPRSRGGRCRETRGVAAPLQ